MKEFTIVRSLFDARKRTLILNENFIKFENKDLKSSPFTVIEKNDIKGIRYGIHFIRGFEFYVGREYQIFIETYSKNDIKISFNLFYRRKLQEKHNLFCAIIDEIWNLYLDEMVQKYLDKIENNQSFELSGIQFEKDKIFVSGKEILFEDINIKNYHHYFMVFSKKDHYQNKMLYYLKDKNAPLLSQLLTIIKTQNE